MNGNPLPPKKEVALALLERGSVHVHLDPRATGVVVPAWFKRQPQLVLQVGLNMPVPIPDLRVDDDGMSCTLSFNRSPFFCIVPWSAVYAQVGDDGRGMVWPDDVPSEVALQARSREADSAPKPAPERPLSVVKSAPEPARKQVAKSTKGRPARAASTTAAEKPKKPRAKKSAPAGTPSPRGRGASPEAGRQGLLVPIAASAKPSRPVAAPSPIGAGGPRKGAAASRADERESPTPTKLGQKPTPQPLPKREEPRPEPPREAPPPSPPRKPGKAKREIPPYLRVVK